MPAGSSADRTKAIEKQENEKMRKKCIFAWFLRVKNSSPKAYKGTILFPVCYSIRFFKAANTEIQLIIEVLSGASGSTWEINLP